MTHPVDFSLWTGHQGACLLQLIHQLGPRPGNLLVLGPAPQGLELPLGEMGLGMLSLPATQEDLETLSRAQRQDISCIALLDCGVFHPACGGLWAALRTLAAQCSANVLVALPNITHKRMVLHLLTGAQDESAQGAFPTLFTDSTLTRWMLDQGLREIDRSDFIYSPTAEPGMISDVADAGGSSVYQYIAYIKGLCDPHGDTLAFVRAYAPDVQSPQILLPEVPSSPRPFLTVLTRTVGKRIASLQETILCLGAQTWDDFEHLIVMHRISPEGRQAVEALVTQTPEPQRSRIRLVDAGGEGRAAPLNVGFALALGEYVSILDDDDMVTANWVETFADLRRDNPGCILHAYATQQRWETLSGPVAGLAAVEALDPSYCVPYEYVPQLNYNRCPTMSLAFPSYAFQRLGLRFDEGLSTAEDYDFLLRAANLCGVANTTEVTSIYRMWENADSSYTQHSLSEWADNLRYIRVKQRSMPVLLPRGTVAALFPPQEGGPQHTTQPTYKSSFYPGGDNAYRKTIMFKAPKFEVRFTFSQPMILSDTVRLDPIEQGNIIVQELKAIFIYENGALEQVVLREMNSNGYQLDGKHVFINQAPQFTMTPPQVQCPVISIYVVGEIHLGVPSDIITALMGRSGRLQRPEQVNTPSLLVRVARRLRR